MPNSYVESGIKSRKINTPSTVDQKTWAWMKLLMEDKVTKKVYDVDPYAAVYQFRDNMYAILTDNLDGGGDSWMYLTIGPEKAFLVDTSYGLGDLKGLVDEITGGMPVIVANTHCSFDHSFGNMRFDKAYCHEFSVDDMENRQNPHIWDYLFDDDGNCIWVEFDRKDLPEFKRYEVVGVPDGYTWNLGGDYEFELIHLPGHQAGHCGFLDKKNRILFSGDAILSQSVQISGNNYPEDHVFVAKDPKKQSTARHRVNSPLFYYTTVNAYRESLYRLSKRLDEFDYIFGGHHVGDFESNVVLNFLEACDEIIADPKNCDYRSGDYHTKFVKGMGVINYHAGAVLPAWEG